MVKNKEDSQKEQNNNLGCGVTFKTNNNRVQKDCILENCDFICGVADGWGKEKLCFDCDKKLREKWDKEDRTSKDPRIKEIHKLRKEGKLNY